MKQGKYIGPKPELQGMEAITKPEYPGYVLAQFNEQYLPGSRVVARPGEGRDKEISYCFDWHRFDLREFEFERTAGHGVGCNCMECWPEPHSLDQLRRR